MHSRPSLNHHTNGDQSLTIEWNFLAAVFVHSLIGAIPVRSEAALCRTLGIRVAASSSKLPVGNMLVGRRYSDAKNEISLEKKEIRIEKWDQRRI